MFKKYYEDCNVGDRVVTPGRTITESDIVMFAAFSGDWNSVHTDREFAAKHSPYGERIAHGLLGLVVGACLLSRCGWYTFWPESMICVTALDKVRFSRPVRIGDTIHLDAQIVEKAEMSDSEGLITTRLRIKNQDGETVIRGRVKIKARRNGDQVRKD